MGVSGGEVGAVYESVSGGGCGVGYESLFGFSRGKSKDGFNLFEIE